MRMGSLIQDSTTKAKKIQKTQSLSMRYQCMKSKRKPKSLRKKKKLEEKYSKVLKVKR